MLARAMGRRGPVYCCTVGFRRRAVASPQLGALDRSDKFAAHWRFRLYLNERVANFRRGGVLSNALVANRMAANPISAFMVIFPYTFSPPIGAQ
jgi:hypothetical protein